MGKHSHAKGEGETAKQLVALGFVACGGGDWMARVGRDQRRIIWRVYPRHPDYGKYIADPDEGGAWDDPLNPPVHRPCVSSRMAADHHPPTS